jgi:hypothetical protein
MSDNEKEPFLSPGEIIGVTCLLAAVSGCTSLPSFGGGGDSEPAPPEDIGAQLVEALPEIADAGSRLLSTFVWTAVVIAVVFPAARVAAVGVFIAFYDRVASWFRPKPGSFTKPESSVNRTDEQ